MALVELLIQAPSYKDAWKRARVLFLTLTPMTVRLMARIAGVSHRDDDFSFGVSFFEIPERFRNLTQGVTSIDDRRYFAGLQKLFQETHVLSV